MAQKKWRASITLTVFENKVIIASSNEAPQKFELSEPFDLTKQKLIEGLTQAGIEIPPDVAKLIPTQTSITELWVDREKNAFAFTIDIKFGDDFILNKYDKIFTIEEAGLTIERDATDAGS